MRAPRKACKYFQSFKEKRHQKLFEVYVANLRNVSNVTQIDIIDFRIQICVRDLYLS